jgi:hypothetical protein
VKKYGTYIILVAGALILGVAAYHLLVRTTADVARSVATAVASALNFTPQIRIEETVVIEQNAPIAELATVARDMMVEYAWSHQWLGSTKTIRLRGTFTAKAGFDLHQPFRLTIRERPLRVEATMPPPRILSLQMNSYTILEDESGWWNRISDDDRERAVMELQRAARSKAETSGLLSDARTSIEQRLREIIERNGAPVDFLHPWQR